MNKEVKKVIIDLIPIPKELLEIAKKQEAELEDEDEDQDED